MASLRLVNQSLLIALLGTCLAAVPLASERRCAYGGDCVLTCTAQREPGVRYRAVRWYKLLHSQQETPESRNGLLMRSLPDGPTRWYAGLLREVHLLDDSWNVLLSNVSCADRGTYVCHLSAPIQVKVFVSLATLMLLGALLLFLFNIGRLKNLLRERSKATIKHILLEAHLHPLDMNALKSIQTLGPKWSNSCKTKHLNV
ncbi:hypothetical protein NHX12_000773 [Muraenolepis orangiensis]|uniref:Ig-like domain-containing protein n=1 Tax=Muraenolepis orangiensis TaxID=630683 RepID=A0A9Q0E1T6_9TELE|nr:hypothetical protein NHX12_000773 [Muraenolepis orangiensis]